MFKFNFHVVAEDSLKYFVADWMTAVPVTVYANDLLEAKEKVLKMMCDPPSRYDKWAIRLQEVEEVGCE